MITGLRVLRVLNIRLLAMRARAERKRHLRDLGGSAELYNLGTEELKELITGDLATERALGEALRAEERRTQAARREKQRQAIATLFVSEHNSRLLFVSGLSASAFAVECFARGLTEGATNWATVLAISFAAAVALDNLLLRFRIKRHLFGGTEYEAREIVRFILRHSDNFDEGEGPRRIFDSIESEASLISEGWGIGANA
jgi:hypothetical protein